MPKKADKNQPEIVAQLRAIGATVLHTHMIGRGSPDIIVGYRGQNYALEIKDGNGRLTEDEEKWHAEWRGSVAIVRTPDEALKAIGAM